MAQTCFNAHGGQRSAHFTGVKVGEKTPLKNLRGGSRFPGASAIDLAEPQFTPAPVFDRVPEHHADHASTEAA